MTPPLIHTDDDRLQRPFAPEPDRRSGEETGPVRPEVDRPGGPDELLKRMRRIDPDQAKKYRQRSGQ